MDTDSNPTWRVHVSEAHFREGVRVVEMPCCGFAYDSLHADASPGETYTCPLCETDDEVAALRADLAIAHTACTETERDMAETIAALRAELAYAISECDKARKRSDTNGFNLRAAEAERDSLRKGHADALDDVFSLKSERDKYRSDASLREADRDRWMDQAIALQQELDALQVKYTDVAFEVEIMRPVVVESVWDVENNVPLPSHLRMAIDAYRATQQEVDA